MSRAVALLVYGEVNAARDVFSEEKYKDLGAAFLTAGFTTKGFLYNDELADPLYHSLLKFDAILVWVNPIEQGRDRTRLDSLLMRLAENGCFVSAHPEVILKIGTKDVLFKTRQMGWAGQVEQYSTYDDFKQRFPTSLKASGCRIIKQYRGNGGNGVFKILLDKSGEEVTVIHAKGESQERNFSWEEFFHAFKEYFNAGSLIEQQWNQNHQNGMVRCYLCGNKVAGFGYQEINALYEMKNKNSTIHLPPGKRYYFTENCGLFQDLKTIMENNWVPQLQASESIADNMLPVIWDADFFINDVSGASADRKYSLCEINASSVSPFPPSAIQFMVQEVSNRIHRIAETMV